MVEMGCTARDKITKTEGVVTGITEYITGCKQMMITYSSDGKPQNSWFDESRLEKIGDDIIEFESGKTQGFGPQAPSK